MPRHIKPKQGREPQYRRDSDGNEQKLCVVQERQRIVSQKSNDEVVVQRNEVKRVGKEKRHPVHNISILAQSRRAQNVPMLRAHQRHAQKLHDIQKHPHGHKRANGHIPAIPKLELFLAALLAQIVQPAPPARQDRVAGPEQAADEEEEERRCDEREQQEVPEYEDERGVQRLRDAVGVGEAPGERCEGEQEREQVGEGGVWAVVGFCGLFLRCIY